MTENATMLVTAAKTIMVFRDALERRGMNRTESNALLLSPTGAAVLLRALDLGRQTTDISKVNCDD